MWKKIPRDVRIKRAGLVRKGLVGNEDGGARRRLWRELCCVAFSPCYGDTELEDGGLVFMLR